MNKKLFVLLVVLMSFSLIGIIFVQGYWIKKSVEDKEEQFSNAVSQVLIRVTDKITEGDAKIILIGMSISRIASGNLKVPILRTIFFIDRDHQFR